MQKSTVESFTQMQQLGQNFAREILSRDMQEYATVLGLRGELGAGKTTFLQGFASGLGVKEVVNSPTFVIMKKFKIPKNYIIQIQRLSDLRYRWFYHIDCYRLDFPDEILQLGFQEIVTNPENIVAIEWPERIIKLLPKNSIYLTFTHVSESTREIYIAL